MEGLVDHYRGLGFVPAGQEGVIEVILSRSDMIRFVLYINTEAAVQRT